MKQRKPLLLLTYFLCLPILYAKESEDGKKEDCSLEEIQDKIKSEVKETLKDSIRSINDRLEEGKISEKEANKEKKVIAEQKAKNLEERQTIARLFYQYAQRNNIDNICNAELPVTKESYEEWIEHVKENEDEFDLSERVESLRDEYNYVYYSRPIVSFGFNNTISDLSLLKDPNHKFAGSRYFEFGWQWSRNLFRNSNRLRFDYGVSIQYNGIKPKDELVFVKNGQQTELQDFGQDLDKSKFRMTNLILPLHIELTDSKKCIEDGDMTFTKPSFKIGFGGFVGVNFSTLQKLKYEEDDNSFKLKQRGDFNTETLIYGLNAFIGSDNLQLFAQYNLNSVFTDNPVEEHNFQLGIRLELGE